MAKLAKNRLPSPYCPPNQLAQVTFSIAGHGREPLRVRHWAAGR